MGADLGARLGPALAALGGAVALCAARPLRAALFLVPWPLVFLVYMGLQERYFGRWLLPALPALCLLAGSAASRSPTARGAAARRGCALAAALVAALLLAQGLVYSVHVDRVLSRDDTRNLARAWMVAQRARRARRSWSSRSCRTLGAATSAGAPRELGAAGGAGQVPDDAHDDDGRCASGAGARSSSIEDYERTLRPALIGSYAARRLLLGVIGSTQYGRAFAGRDEVPNAIRYYRALARHGDGRVPSLARTGRARARSIQLRLELRPLPAGVRAPGPDVVVYRLRRRALRIGYRAHRAVPGSRRARILGACAHAERCTDHRTTCYLRESDRARRARRGHTSPNPLVGAVVVRDGEVLGEGYHAAYGGPHAEVAALDALPAADPIGATMYVTLEPCCHHGPDAALHRRDRERRHQARGGRLGRPDREGVRPRARDPARRGHRGRRSSTASIARSARLLNQPFRKHARTGRPLRDLQVGDEPRRQGRDPDRRLEVDLRRGEPPARAPLARRGRRGLHRDRHRARGRSAADRARAEGVTRQPRAGRVRLRGAAAARQHSWCAPRPRCR